MSYSGLDGGLATRRAPDVSVSPPPRDPRAGHVPRRELELKLAALEKDYADLQRAIAEAAQVYRRLCAPRLVRHGSFEIASETFAVRHVPGDFFTVEETSNGVILALGDVCGKGLGAGMWTPHLVGLTATHTAANDEPSAIVAGINRDLCRISSVAPLASLFLARLDPADGRLEYTSAGHPPSLLLRADGTIESLSDGGPLLGVLPDAPFATGVLELGDDDVLLAFSDGILESMDDADREFGYERLHEQLRRAGSDTADSILFSVLGAVQDFAGARPLVDDMSLVVIRRRGFTTNRQRFSGLPRSR